MEYYSVHVKLTPLVKLDNDYSKPTDETGETDVQDEKTGVFVVNYTGFF